MANKTHIGERNISISLKNRNDELPIFANDFIQVNVPEDVAKGYPIATMLATDRDIGDSVVLVYIDLLNNVKKKNSY